MLDLIPTVLELEHGDLPRLRLPRAACANSLLLHPLLPPHHHHGRPFTIIPQGRCQSPHLLPLIHHHNYRRRKKRALLAGSRGYGACTDMDRLHPSNFSSAHGQSRPFQFLFLLPFTASHLFYQKASSIAASYGLLVLCHQEMQTTALFRVSDLPFLPPIPLLSCCIACVECGMWNVDPNERLGFPPINPDLSRHAVDLFTHSTIHSTTYKPGTETQSITMFLLIFMV